MDQHSIVFPNPDLLFRIDEDRVNVFCSCGAFLTYRLYNGSTVKETCDIISLYFPGVYNRCPFCKLEFGLTVVE